MAQVFAENAAEAKRATRCHAQPSRTPAKCELAAPAIARVLLKSEIAGEPLVTLRPRAGMPAIAERCQSRLIF
jgi:hypothetical protein